QEECRARREIRVRQEQRRRVYPAKKKSDSIRNSGTDSAEENGAFQRHRLASLLMKLGCFRSLSPEYVGLKAKPMARKSSQNFLLQRRIDGSTNHGKFFR
ncbi:hypothetical protein AMECASPLE_019207, partial [Ameca splendens]